MAIVKLETRYADIKDKKSYLNNRQKEIMEFIINNEPVKIKDIIDNLINYTSYTLKKDVKYLVTEGLLKKMGKARATIYIVKAPKE